MDIATGRVISKRWMNTFIPCRAFAPMRKPVLLMGLPWAILKLRSFAIVSFRLNACHIKKLIFFPLGHIFDCFLAIRNDDRTLYFDIRLHMIFLNLNP
jgi:hypothetical protein